MKYTKVRKDVNAPTYVCWRNMISRTTYPWDQSEASCHIS